MTDTVPKWDGLTEAAAALAKDVDHVIYDFSYADCLEILRLVDTSSHVKKLKLSIGEMSVEIERDGDSAPHGKSAAAIGSNPAATNSPAAPEPAAEPQSAPIEVAVTPDDVVPVRSPIAGVYYRSPAPDEPPFVEIGSVVTEDTVVGIIEVMKVMNNIRAGCSGVVAGFSAENEDLVQFDQALLYVNPEEQDFPK